jgi:tetratricopeptide (TPR) repeat protein
VKKSIHKTFVLAAILLLCCASPLYPQQRNVIDSLRSLFKTGKDDTNKVKIALRIGVEYESVQKRDSAGFYYLYSKSLSEKLQYLKGIADACHSIGVIKLDQGDLKGSLDNYFAALEIRKKIGDKKGMARSYNNIGNDYRNMGLFSEALKYHFYSLRLKDELKDEKGKATTYNNIGIVYNLMHRNPEALNYYNLAVKIRRAYKDTLNINYANTLSNFGNIYWDEALLAKNKYKGNQKNDSVKKYLGLAVNLFNSALIIRTALKDSIGIADCYVSRGSVLLEQNKINDALKSYNFALKLYQQHNSPDRVALSFNNIGRVLFSQKKFGESRDLFSRGLKIAKEINSKDYIKTSYKGLAETDSALGNYASAFRNYKWFIVWKDSVFNEASTKKITQTQMQYEFDKKAAADSIKVNETKRLENEKHRQEISTQRTYTYAGVSGFLVMIIIAGISYRAFRSKRKANIEIANQKMLVEERQKEILDSIRYAKRIQTALITNEKYIERKLGLLNKKQV